MFWWRKRGVHPSGKVRPSTVVVMLLEGSWGGEACVLWPTEEEDRVVYVLHTVESVEQRGRRAFEGELPFRYVYLIPGFEFKGEAAVPDEFVLSLSLLLEWATQSGKIPEGYPALYELWQALNGLGVERKGWAEAVVQAEEKLCKAYDHFAPHVSHLLKVRHPDGRSTYALGPWEVPDGAEVVGKVTVRRAVEGALRERYGRELRGKLKEGTERVLEELRLSEVLAFLNGVGRGACAKH